MYILLIIITYCYLLLLLFIKTRACVKVIAQRQKYLERYQRAETVPKFLQLSEGLVVDWAIIDSKIQQEAANERTRPGAKPFSK